MTARKPTEPAWLVASRRHKAEQLDLLGNDLAPQTFRISHASPALQARVRVHVDKQMARYVDRWQHTGPLPEQSDVIRYQRAKAVVNATGQALALELGAEPASWTW